MSGSAGASPSRRSPPSLPPDDADEQTTEYVHPVPRKPTIDALLPPGADEEPAPPPLVGPGPMMAEFIAPEVGPREAARALSAPTIDTIATPPARRAISPEERAQRRFWKNAILFGVCLVVLMVVCFLLAR